MKCHALKLKDHALDKDGGKYHLHSHVRTANMKLQMEGSLIEQNRLEKG